MPAVHCDQVNSSYMTMHAYQAKKSKLYSALRQKFECSPSSVVDDIQKFFGESCGRITKIHDLIYF